MTTPISDAADRIARSGRYLRFNITMRWWIVVACSSVVMISTPAGVSASPSIPHQSGISMPSGAVTTAADELASLIGDLNVSGKYVGSVTTMRVDEGAGRVIVYASDTQRAAEAATAAADRLDLNKRARVLAEVRPSKYSRQELEAAMALLWEEAEEWRQSGVELFVIALNRDGSGLTAEVNDPDSAASVATSAEAESIGAVARSDVIFERGSQPRDTTRFFDTPPYNSGIYIRNAAGGACTNAFSIQQGSAEFLITAEHCFAVGTPIYQGGGVHVGNIISENTRHDAASIRTADTWSGVFILNEDVWRNFRSAQWTFQGMNVCQSGYVSNQICDFDVTHSYIEWTGSNGNLRAGVRACRRSGGLASQPGDSGGPVYSFRADGYLDSRGIVSSRSTANNSCLFFTETRALLGVWNVAIITS